MSLPSHGCGMTRNNKEQRLYEKIGAEKCCSVVNRRRSSWLGQLLMLDEETPVKEALAEYLI